MIKENNFKSRYAKGRAMAYVLNKNKGKDAALNAVNDFNAQTNALADINAERSKNKPERIYVKVEEEPWEREQRLKRDDERSDFKYLYDDDFKYNPDEYYPYFDEGKHRTLRLTESQLHQVIKESVKRLVKEYYDGEENDWNQWDDEMDGIDGREDEWKEKNNVF